MGIRARLRKFYWRSMVMGRLQAKRCKVCGELKMLRGDLCARCQSIQDQELEIGFYDPLRIKNPEEYYKREQARATARHREENFAGMVLSLLVGGILLLAGIGTLIEWIWRAPIGK